MSEQTKINQALLIKTLETFGADPVRWPDPIRAGLQALIVDSAEAKAAFDEFAALDQLLGTVDAYDGGGATSHAALADRIMAAVGGVESISVRDDNVVRFDTARRRAPLQQRTHSAWPNVAAASALAASLLLGISVGATGVANSTLTPVSEALGLGSIGTETASLSDSIFDVVDDGTFDEDVL